MATYLSKEQLLKKQLQHILNSENLSTQRAQVTAVCDGLGIDIMECAAALLWLTENPNTALPVTEQKKPSQPGIKMVRYRLDVGTKHQLTLEELKKVLVEESGVDKNNINNVSIRGLYTLIELPDSMPADIFQHLKSVEINQQKLDIKRVKPRNKKRGNYNSRRDRQRNTKSANEIQAGKMEKQSD